MRSRARCLTHAIDSSIPSVAPVSSASLNFTICVPAKSARYHAPCNTAASTAAACSLAPASGSKCATMRTGIGRPVFERSTCFTSSLSHHHNIMFSRRQPHSASRLSSGSYGSQSHVLRSSWEGNSHRLWSNPDSIRSYHRSTATAAAAAHREQAANPEPHASPKALLSEALQTLVGEPKLDTDVTSISSLGPFQAVVKLPQSLQAIFPAGTVSTLLHTYS